MNKNTIARRTVVVCMIVISVVLVIMPILSCVYHSKTVDDSKNATTQELIDPSEWFIVDNENNIYSIEEPLLYSDFIYVEQYDMKNTVECIEITCLYIDNVVNAYVSGKYTVVAMQEMYEEVGRLESVRALYCRDLNKWVIS